MKSKKVSEKIPETIFATVKTLLIEINPASLYHRQRKAEKYKFDLLQDDSD